MDSLKRTNLDRRFKSCRRSLTAGVESVAFSQFSVIATSRCRTIPKQQKSTLFLWIKFARISLSTPTTLCSAFASQTSANVPFKFARTNFFKAPSTRGKLGRSAPTSCMKRASTKMLSKSFRPPTQANLTRTTIAWRPSKPGIKMH